MKNTTKIMLAVLALGASAFIASSQDSGTAPGGTPPHGSGPRGHRPPPPIIAALDANHDGVIDADEIANASTALKTLDKNGDGKLTQDELRPPRPPQDAGPESGDDKPPGPPREDQ
ncbi:MAG: hypothetical protein WDM80_18750 [Limisphaerales bacterium]